MPMLYIDRKLSMTGAPSVLLLLLRVRFWNLDSACGSVYSGLGYGKLGRGTVGCMGIVPPHV